MRKPRSLFFVLALLLLMQACAPAAPEPQPTPTNDPFSLSNLSTANDATAGATLQPVTTPSGPQMDVGALYRYFDGALLDAVPDNGPFIMGDNIQDAPQHQVSVSSFWIYNVEVSNAMYAWCVQVGKCSPPDRVDNPNFGDASHANFPVVGVDWQDASNYCSFAHGHLPTEAQWEKAASWDPSAKAKRIYPWGVHKTSCDYLNFLGCGNHTTSVIDHGLGQSAYGPLNMAGNVSEWTADWYGSGYYASSPAKDPQGPDQGARRVIRGGSFNSDAFLAAATRRFSADPTNHRPDLGFRCVVDDPTYFAPFCTAPVYHGVVISPSSSALPTPSKPCPDPVIQHFNGCGQSKAPVNYVTILNSSPTNVTVSGLESCNPGSNDVGVTHECKLGVTIQVQATCDVPAPGSAACPPNYTLDPKNPNQCVANGAAGSCPTGYQFNAATQCCSIAQGANAPAPLCAVGEHLYEGVCVDDMSGPQPPVSLTYVTSSGFDCAPDNAGHQCSPGEKYVCNANGCSCH